MEIDDERVARVLVSLLAARAADASICPSDVARTLMHEDEASWRALMPQVRSVAASLAAQERVRITRGAVTLDPANLEGGPIRLRRGVRFDDG